MDIVLGVSMAPTTVRMVLVEGDKADGRTVDHDTVEVPAGHGAATSGAVQQVVAAILGTRESAAEGGHRLASTGVVWSDHAAAAQLRRSLRANRIDGVVMVSELHAASALAQAIGTTIGIERTALMFLDRDSATLAVVRTSDGAVVRVHSRGLAATDATELREMVARLEQLDEPPQALFLVGSGGGSGLDMETVKSEVASVTHLPVHAPDDGDLALARGAALASANTPRYEAETVGLAPGDDTEAAIGLTQAADVAYMAPLGYSAVPDDVDGVDDFGDDSATSLRVAPPEPDEAESKPFFLVGSALAALFVLGVAALVISLAVTIRPTAEQRPDPGSGSVDTTQGPADEVAGPAGPAAPETIQAPVPVVQEAPRTVFVTPRAPAAAPAPAVAPPAVAPVAPAAPAPAPVPVPAAVPAPVPAPAPAPVIAPIPIVVPIPLPAPVLPSILQPPSRRTQSPVTQSPVTQAPVTQAPVTQSPVTQAPVTQSPVTQEAPVTQSPVTQSPVTQSPVTQSPVITESTPAYTPPSASSQAPVVPTPTQSGSGTTQSSPCPSALASAGLCS